MFVQDTKLFQSVRKLSTVRFFCVVGRCRQENEYPYFLSMLSERYGYVMDPADVPSDIKARSVHGHS